MKVQTLHALHDRKLLVLIQLLIFLLLMFPLRYQILGYCVQSQKQ